MAPNSVNLCILSSTKEENNENRQLTLGPTDESKDKLKRYEEMWSKIKDPVRSTNNKSDYYDEKYMKIKIHSHKLTQKKTL